jgi:hypothetical protein
MESLTAAVARSFPELAEYVVSIINFLIPMVISASVVAYFYYGGKGILSGKSSESATALRQNMLWGALILFFMISIYGIVSFLEQSILK